MTMGHIKSKQVSGDYTLARTDAGCIVESVSADPVTITIPGDGSHWWEDGAIVEVFQAGAGPVTIAGAADVTLLAPGDRVVTAEQYSTVGLRCRAGNEWVLSGALA